MADTIRRRPSDAAAATLTRPGDFSNTTARTLARDAATGRIGEIMHIARENELPVEIWLRQVGGGCEWTAKPEDVTRIPHDPRCRCNGTGTVSRVVPLAGAVLITDLPCPGGEVT